MRATVRRSAALAAAILAMLVLGITSLAGGATGINGRGSTGLGGLTLTMAAELLPNGSAAGHSRLLGGATGRVIQVVPPSGAIDFWCITVDRTDTAPTASHINWYIRDLGDGKTTFDQISFVSGLTQVNCTTFPVALGSFLTLTNGDFKAH